mgnify:CR=1 FL=1
MLKQEEAAKKFLHNGNEEDRYEVLERTRKEILATCESEEGLRCQVAEFYGGLEYRLIVRTEIRDLRLVYVPSDEVYFFGGDEDNWMWPRHTGDFAFYRAYVAPDGTAADYSPDNVPFKPEHHLKVSRAGLEDGDFVMAAGYPGSTSRYATLTEVENTFGWQYPTMVTMLNEKRTNEAGEQDMHALLQRLEHEVTGMREKAMVLLPDEILGKQRRVQP